LRFTSPNSSAASPSSATRPTSTVPAIRGIIAGQQKRGTKSSFVLLRPSGFAGTPAPRGMMQSATNPVSRTRKVIRWRRAHLCRRLYLTYL
jgi:hypothetical protein